MSELNLVLLCSGIVIAGVVIGFIIYRRRNPSAAAQAETVAKAELAKALADLRSYLSAKLEPQEPPTLPDAVVVAPAGKKGQAGVISFPVGGADFQADLAAFMAAYNG